MNILSRTLLSLTMRILCATHLRRRKCATASTILGCHPWYRPERKCLLITATQTGRATVGGQKDADEADVAEDIRKVAHVTKMIMINQNAAEREQGLYRLACNTTRDEPVAPSQLLCTSCLAICEPMMDAHMIANVDIQAENDEDEPQRTPARGRRGGFKL